MKRRIAAIAALVGIFFGLVSVAVAHAQTFSTIVAANKTIDGSLYSVGREIDIEGTINGDILCFGQNILINATVHGDVVCGGQNISINGHVDGNVRAASLSVVMDAIVGGSASLAAQTVNVKSTSTVGRDFSVAGSSAKVAGTIGRDGSFASKKTQINASIGRNVVMSGSSLALQDQAHIAGNLSYTSIDAISKSPLAKVDGQTQHHSLPASKKNHIAVFGILSTLAFPMLLLFALVMVLLFPQMFHKASRFPAKSILKTMFVGVFTLFVLPIALFLLIASVVGAAAAIALILAWLLLLMLSGPAAAYYVGSMVAAKSKNAVLIMFVGTIIMLILYLLPQIGIVFGIFAYVIGAGALIQYTKAHFKKPNYRIE